MTQHGVLSNINLTFLPSEIISEIAEHLPSVEDVLSLSSVNHMLRDAISTPVVFKHRVALHGWDVEPWEDILGNPIPDKDMLRRWQKIDLAHERMDELMETGTRINPPEFNADNPMPALPTIMWAVHTLDLLSLILENHCHMNSLRLCSEAHRGLWPMAIEILDLANDWSVDGSRGRANVFQDLYRTRFQTLHPTQHALFNLVSVLCTQDTAVLRSLFGSAFCSITTIPKYHVLIDLRMSSDVTNDNYHRFSPCSLSFAILLLHLRLKPNFKHLLPGISMPVQPAMHNFQLGQRLSTSDFPFNSLLPAETRPRWVGFYSYAWDGTLMLDPPMRISFTSVEQELDQVIFFATANDSVGPFNLSGSISLKSGNVEAMKRYTMVGGPVWPWDGTVLPWGMVGAWGEDHQHGWWWIWPELA